MQEKQKNSVKRILKSKVPKGFLLPEEAEYYKNCLPTFCDLIAFRFVLRAADNDGSFKTLLQLLGVTPDTPDRVTIIDDIGKNGGD